MRLRAEKNVCSCDTRRVPLPTLIVTACSCLTLPCVTMSEAPRVTGLAEGLQV